MRINEEPKIYVCVEAVARAICIQETVLSLPPAFVIVRENR